MTRIAFAPRETLLSLLTGITSAAMTQPRSGWWLNSGRGALITLAPLFVIAAFSGRWPRGSRSRRATALWAGSMSGLAVYLWAVGPGTLWPIVLAVCAVLTASTVAAGSAVGWLSRV